MSCPLSALANIAAMTTGSSTIHSFTTGDCDAPPAAAIGLSTKKPMSKTTRTKPTKKRSAADDLNTADNVSYHQPALSNKKARNSSKTNTNDSDRRQEATIFQTKANQPSFPTVLMGIMSAPQNIDCITFLSDESSIIIINPEAVAKNVLPIHFEGNVPTYDLFLNLLTMWGFNVVQDPQYPKVKVYQHPMFQKGDWEACLQMQLPEEVNRSNIQAMDTSPIRQQGEALISRAELLKLKPPSPHQRQLSFDSGSGAGGRSSQSPPLEARSVTPPEIITSLPYQAISQSLSQESASQWLMQSAMLEQMIVATAKTRRRLSGFSAINVAAVPSDGYFSVDKMSLEEMAINYPDSQSVHHQGTRNSSAMGYQNLETHASSSPSMMARSMGRMSPPSSFTQESKGPSDAQLQWMTSNVVSAAIAALHGSEQHKQRQQPQSPVELLRNTVNLRSNNLSFSSPSSPSSLDAMTEAFLERSLARRMQSRPPGILAPSLARLATTFYNTGASNVIDAQTRALLTGQ